MTYTISIERCTYPACVDNEDERCPRWLTGECAGPNAQGVAIAVPKAPAGFMRLWPSYYQGVQVKPSAEHLANMQQQFGWVWCECGSNGMPVDPEHA